MTLINENKINFPENAHNLEEDNHLIDREKIKKNLDKQKRLADIFRTLAGVETIRIQKRAQEYQPFGLSDNFIYNYDFESIFPPDTAEQLQKAFREFPDLILKATINEFPDFEQYYSGLDNNSGSVIENYKKYDELKKQANTENIAKFFREIGISDQLANQYLQELTPQNAELLLMRIKDIQRELKALQYFEVAAEIASNILIDLAPSLKELIQESVNLTVFVKDFKSPIMSVDYRHATASYRKRRPSSSKDIFVNMADSENDLKHWGMISTEELNILCGDEESLLSEENFYKNVVIISHEIMHAVSYKLLKLEEMHLARDGQSIESYYESDLANVISEGVSIAFEHESIRQLLSLNIPENAKQTLRIFRRERINIFNETHNLWQKKARAALVGKNEDDQGVPHTYDSPRIAYSEGARLGFNLRKNGWRINDLPELADHIRGIVQKIVGIKTPIKDGIRKIAVSDNIQYEEFRRKLAKLKKIPSSHTA